MIPKEIETDSLYFKTQCFSKKSFVFILTNNCFRSFKTDFIYLIVSDLQCCANFGCSAK